MKRVTTIATRLKEFRDTHDLTLADMERQTGIPAQTLNRYELGQRAPKIDVAVQVAEQLHINPLWLQGYDVPESEAEPPTVTDEGLNEVIAIFQKLSPDNRAKLLELSLLYLDAQNKTE